MTNKKGTFKIRKYTFSIINPNLSTFTIGSLCQILYCTQNISGHWFKLGISRGDEFLGEDTFSGSFLLLCS
jgi:hypothetical protein